MIVTEQEIFFSVLFLISLITDILDGWIARKLQMESELGAKLDSWADTFTYIAGFWAVFSLKWNEIEPHILWIITFASAWVTIYLTMFIKFRSIIGLHTYSYKITAYLQGVCLIALFWFGFWSWLFYLAIVWGILSCLEEILIVCILTEPKTDVRGLLYLMREQK
jgi:CDP-diacylglycerol--glycerol-3-phosphate 3-phosphatidyltransferase